MKKHKQIDKQTLAMIDDRYGLLDVMDELLAYVQLSNKDIVAIKTTINGNTGMDINPLSDKDKRTLREGGDKITAIRKLIAQGRKVKNDA